MEIRQIEGKLVDIIGGSISPGILTIQHGIIQKITRQKSNSGPYLIPGFIDAHVHIESSMLVPAEFARLAVVHGTVATISDPHEIANVLGISGVQYMINNIKDVPFKCYFGAPSCVPATSFETSGAKIDSNQIELLLANPDVHYLAEMMNWPGVIHGDQEVMRKIQCAAKYHKPVDGHAPGVTGDNIKKYVEAGISTDHECSSIEEALEKLPLGMKILIREGSAARNFNALIPLLPEYADKVMFCSDDLHPDSLVKGHINLLVQRAVANGIDPLIALRVASKNPIDHYNLDVGLLQEGDPADLVTVENLTDFNVLQVFINGHPVAKNNKTLIPRKTTTRPNNFMTSSKTPQDFSIKASGNKLRVMIAEDGQLITKQKITYPKIDQGMVISDTDRDILKIVVVNRYRETPPQIGFVQNFGLKQGAIASSVAHDCHNIIAVGVEDRYLCAAVNEIIAHKGGVAAVSPSEQKTLPLPVAGLMSDQNGYQLAEDYITVDALAKSMGSKLDAPFMTLSFMALLVIPELKLSDLGLFNGTDFKFESLFVD
ncbi:MAG: adenine deaminase [Cyclobacteriaceae bacterium]|nr:MAG: adenine deaminase [Cyclobacteriaceae bacterium]